MSLAQTKQVEMVYGIYYGNTKDGYNGPDSERQAGCVIGENQPDLDIIANLVASDFLSQWNEYVVVDNGPSIHIHHKVNGKIGGIALVLMYEEDIEPMECPKIRTFKEIDAKYKTAEEKLEALTLAGFELEEIVDIALAVG